MTQRTRRTSFLEVSGDMYHSSHSYSKHQQSVLTNESITEDDDDAEDAAEGRHLLPKHKDAQGKRFKVIRWLETIAYCAGNFSVGVLVSVIGPTLNDLAHNIHTDLDTISLIYSVRAAGYLLTTLVLGWSIEKMNFDLFFGLTTILAAGASLTFPYIDHMVYLCLAIFTHGVIIGCVDTGGNVMIIKLWRRKAGPLIQALSFFLGLGTCIGPIIIHIFPSSEDGVADTDTDTITHAPLSLFNDISNYFDSPLYNTGSSNISTSAVFGSNISSTVPSTTGGWNTTNVVTHPYIPIPTNSLLGVYGVAGGLTAVSAVYLLILFVIQVRKPLRLDNLELTQVSVRMAQKPGFTNKICFLLFLFFMGYQGVIIAYGSLVAPFVRTFPLHITRLDAASLNSVYWGAFAVGRLVCIPISTYVHPRYIILVDILGSITSMIFLVFYADNNLTMLWVFNGFLGLSYSSVFPAMWAWAERYLEVTGKIGAILMVGSALGEMILPPSIGELYNVYSGMALMYVALGVTLLLALVFTLLNVVVYRCGTRIAPVEKSVLEEGNSVFI